jgi:hypothetical protein
VDEGLTPSAALTVALHWEAVNAGPGSLRVLSRRSVADLRFGDRFSRSR